MKSKLFASLMVLLMGFSALAQNVVSGVVKDNVGPAIGVSVIEQGTTNGTITDMNGNFSLKVKPGASLVFSSIGYKDQIVEVGDQSSFDILIEEDNELLEEVVVVGYGVQKKKLVTGSTIQVKGDDIAKMNTANALTAMQSQAPGVQITQASAQPGKGFKVSIRGVGTIGTSSPILVIDGIYSGTADDGLNGLNPSDIESIDVLKDAASAAIYGARAANGVILVTTKQGKAGSIQVNYDGYVGISNPYRKPSLLNAQEYMAIIDETNFNMYGTATDWGSIVPAAVLNDVNNGWEGTDWWDLYENRNALQQSHSVSVNGGNDRSKFAMAVGYTDNEGIMGGDLASNFKRYTGRINSEHVVLRLNDRDIIKVGENISFWDHNAHDLAESNGYWNIVKNALMASPLVPAYDANGNLYNYGDNGMGWSSNIFVNPLEGLMNGEYNSINRSHTFGVGATFFWEVSPVRGLKYRGQVNTGYGGYNQRSESMPFSESSTNGSSNYGIQMSINDNASLSLENTISYVLPELNGHNLDFLVGQSIEMSQWSSNAYMTASTSANSVNTLVLKGFDYAIPSNFEALTGHSGGTYGKQGNIASFFGRANWNYREKYMATAILRADGSKNFARGKRWGFFPSFSAGWVISNEDFMTDLKGKVDFLKVRASWGQNGNCEIGNFYYTSNIGFSPTSYADFCYRFGSNMLDTVSGNYASGAYARNMPNPDVTWETSEQIDLGIDARFLKDRLTLVADVYSKKTKDWLVQAPVLDLYGYEEAAYVNGGDIANKGVELGLGWQDNVSRDFAYHANLNLAYNKNEVTRLASASGIIGNGSDMMKTLFENSSYVALVQVGQPVGYFNGMSHSGIWQTQDQIDEARAANKAVAANAVPGDPIWDDFNEDGMIDYDSDRHYIGNPNPDVTLGITLGFDYKGFDFNVTGYGAFGQQIMQCYRTALLANQYQNYTTDVFKRWHGQGTTNTYPRLTVGGEANQWISDLYMQQGSFFKIQNVTLGYDINKVWKSSPFSRLRVYVQAQNLFTFTKYTGCDPEIASNGGTNASWARGIDVGLYPSARTYLAGVNIGFGQKGNVAEGAEKVKYITKEVVREIIKEVPVEVVKEVPVEVIKYVEKDSKAIGDADIFFNIGSSEITSMEALKVKQLARYLKANPDAKVVISGHADKGTGTDEINQMLVEQRAAAVVKMLKNEGIGAGRISTEFNGTEKDSGISAEENRVAVCILK